VELKGGMRGLKLVTRQFVLKRGDNVVVKVSWDPPPPTSPTGKPLSPLALVSEPTKIKGIESWTIETRQHRSDVRAVAYSPDGKLLASAGGDGSIRFWDTDTYQLRGILLGHLDAVLCLAWSPDGKILATGSKDKTICLWEPKSGKVLRTLEGHTGLVSMLAWAPNGKTLASGSKDDYIFRYPSPERLSDQKGDDTIRLWSLDSDHPKLTFPAKNFSALAWSRDGKVLAIRAGKSLDLRDADSGKLLKSLESEVESGQWASGLAWSSNGKSLAAAGRTRGQVVVWDPEKAQPTHQFYPRKGSPLPASAITSLAWSPDAKTLACGYYCNVAGLVLCDPDSGKIVHNLNIEPPGTVLSIAWAPNGKSLAVALGDRNFVRIWRAETGRILHNVEDQTPITRGLAYPTNPKGKPIGFSFKDNRLQAIDLDTGRVRSSLPCARNWEDTAAISPDGKTIAATVRGPEIQVWEPAAGPAFQTLNITPAQEGPARAWALAWSRDGKFLASGHADHTVHLWGADGLSHIRSLDAHQAAVMSLDWSPTGELLASGSDDQSVRIWDAAAGKCVHVLSATNHKVHALRWSPNGKILAAGCEDGSVDLWDPVGEKLLASLHGHERRVAALAWSPDGKNLASAGTDGKLMQWDINSGKAVRTLRGATDGRSLYWSADGETLISVF
jgi:WD40 repeat protein